jgi:hypothetical protein
LINSKITSVIFAKGFNGKGGKEKRQKEKDKWQNAKQFRLIQKIKSLKGINLNNRG